MIPSTNKNINDQTRPPYITPEEPSAALVFICSSLVDASELSYALSDDEIWDGKVEGSDICLWWPLCSVG
jgi:hypothetical protein